MKDHACIFAIGSFVAIVVTLYPFQHNPLPSWPYGLSINTLVSIYTIMFQVAMMTIVSSRENPLATENFNESPRPADLMFLSSRPGAAQIPLVSEAKKTIRLEALRRGFQGGV